MHLKNLKRKRNGIEFGVYLLFLLSGCGQGVQQSDYIHINLSKRLPANPVNASTLIEACRYIPLETTDESVIGSVNRIIPVQDGFFIFDASKRVSFFDAEGRFVRRIASKGQGPGEYIDLFGFDLSEEERLLYLFDTSRQILVYTFDNTFVRSIRLDVLYISFMKTSWGYIAYKSPIMQSRFNAEKYEKEMPVLVSLDEDGKVLNVLQYGNFNSTQNLPMIIHAMFKKHNGQYYYYPEFQDTIYSVQVDKIVPEYILSKGRYRITMDDIETLDNWRVSLSQGLMLTNFVIDNHRLILWCRRRNNMETYLYDFSSGKLSGISEIVNDMDHSCNFSPLMIYQHQWIEVRDASGILKESKELPAALKNLDSEDNPVIRISTLKL